MCGETCSYINNEDALKCRTLTTYWTALWAWLHASIFGQITLVSHKQKQFTERKDIIGLEYILLVWTAWKLPLTKWNWDWKKTYKKWRHCQECLFWGEFLLSLHWWISSQNLHWGLSRTRYTGIRTPCDKLHPFFNIWRKRKVPRISRKNYMYLYITTVSWCHKFF